MNGWFEEYLGMLHDPAHWAFELTVQFVIDLVILYFGYKVIFKKVILPKIRKDIHSEIDRDHDLIHNEYSEQDLELIRRMKGARFGLSGRFVLPSGRQITGDEMTRLVELYNEVEDEHDAQR